MKDQIPAKGKEGADMENDRMHQLRAYLRRPPGWEIKDVLALHELPDGPRFIKYEDSETVLLRCRFCEQELVFARPLAIDLEIALAVHADACQRPEVRR